ncbi:FG-GAP repeat protein [Solirubrobacter ginsenosidimutans]|uniref:FG-GAP repeat protein n=1 Tax=Solirubrobacter ginsenosidimutans TaxID=490573 RepID=A0A9X3S1Y8_9ACTN|nr:FG-GAP repeat protein [Solirubrobacter ginsenosidimutans]MDA0160621.1 FG-GAP repeat protein [Solirubrobacter ginsenosidimutans]
MVVLLGVVFAGTASAVRPGSPGASGRASLSQLPTGLASAVRSAVVTSPQQKLRVPNTALFGFSVSLSSDGGVALIGAPNTDPPNGAAYVFARIGGIWILQQKLQVIHPIPFSARFGSSVSLSSDGRTALIGAQGTNPASGGQDTAYVFARNFAGLFMLQQELPNPAGASSGNAFGFSASLGSDGRTAVIGAPNTGGGNSPTGAAYVFARGLFGGWTLQQTLRPSDNAFDAFGSSVSLSSDSRSALIGAPSRDGGAAYVFARGLAGGFSQQQKLQASDRASVDAFGGSVSLSGDGRTALIGASQKAIGPNDFQGAAYVFTRGVAGGFTQLQRLQAADGAAFDAFGTSVSLDSSGTRALIGAPGVDGETGAAYLFARGTVGGFTQRQELQAADRATRDFFGWSVTLSSDHRVALIGAIQIPDTPAPRTGAAYVFPGLT